MSLKKKDVKDEMNDLREKTNIITVHNRIFSIEGKAIISTFTKKLKESDEPDKVDELLEELEDVLKEYRLVDIIMASHIILTDTIRCSVDFENLKVTTKSKNENEKTDNYIR